MARYAALLTNRQTELLILLDEKIDTVPGITEKLNSVNADMGDPWVTRESIYQSLLWMLGRGLVIKDDEPWPHRWAASDKGREALEISESTTSLRPR